LLDINGHEIRPLGLRSGGHKLLLLLLLLLLLSRRDLLFNIKWNFVYQSLLEVEGLWCGRQLLLLLVCVSCMLL
jgi:hypothetical protein